MKKREFLKSVGIGLLGLAAPRRRPKNWVSIPAGPSRTEEEWSALFERLHASAVEAVAVEMRGDPLETVLRVSRRHALEVHARVAIHIPDGDGPLPAGTGERTRSRVADLADVPTLFGIHLDPLGLHGPLPRRECTSRCSDELTELVNKHLVPAARSRGSLITTAVPASAIPRWSRWALDAFVAVVADAAERGAEGVGKPIAEAVAAVTVPVYCGLLPRALEAPALAEISRAALAAGAAGIFLFDVEAMDEGRWSAFQDAVAGS